MSQNGMKTPFLTTPLTRRLRMLDNLQWHTFCADFELKAVLCYESYGFSSNKCDDYMDDLRECVLGAKRQLRVDAMNKERIIQYKEGTRKELFAPPPPDDAY